MPVTHSPTNSSWPDVKLSRVEQILISKAVAGSNEDARKWLGDAISHYERWQHMWAGPFAKDDEISAEVELFATLAENAPHCLRGHWRLLHELVRLNSAMWACPRESLDEYEMGLEPKMPYLDRVALAAAWPRLRAVADGFAPHSTHASTDVAR
jgi:hypothetical protein